MTEPVLIPAGGGEIVGDSADRRVEILSDREALAATWSRFAPGREGADLHVHRRHSDLFYVLEGELTLRLGPEDRAVPLPAATLARVPPGVVHGFRNGGDAEVRYLNFHAPGQRFADYLRALRQGRSFAYDQYPPPPDGGRSPADAVVGAAPLAADRPGLRVALLADVQEIAIAEVRPEPGAASEQPYVERRHLESLYVLEGALTLTAGERELPAAAGAWLQVPPSVPYRLAFPAERPVRFLEVRTAGGA